MTEDLRQAWEEHGGLRSTATLPKWCRRLREMGSALLPIKLGDTRYLASLATSGSEWRVIHYVIRQAFTSDMLDLDGVSDTAGMSRQLLSAMSDAGVTSWRLHEVRDVQAWWASYEALNTVEDGRASLEGSVAKSSGQLIRRFRSAVDAEDDEAAGQWLEELKGYQTVDRHNLAFLALWREVRLRPSSVHTSSELHLATGQHERMPFDLRNLVGRTVLEHAVAPWVAEHGVERVGEVVVGPQSLIPSELLEQCCTLTSSVGSAFRVFAALLEPESRIGEADWSAVAEAFAWLEPIREILDRQADVVPSKQQKVEQTPRPDEPDRGVAALTAEQQIRDCASRIKALDNGDVYAMLSLVEKGDAGAGDVLRQWWDLLGPTEREANRGLAPFTEALAKADEATDPQPEDWLAYMAAGADGARFSYAELPLVADDGNDAQWHEFAELLSQFDERRFVECLPTLTRAWSSSPKHTEVTSAFVEKVHFALLEDEGALGAGNRVEHLSSFLAVALDAGLSAEHYSSFLKDLGVVVRGISSYRLLEELIDVLELLVDGKYPDPDALSHLLRDFQAASQRHCTKMDRAALDVLCALLDGVTFADLTAEASALREALPPEEASDCAEAVAECPLRGKKLLIYTLDTPSGERAKNLIEERFAATVRTDASKQASAALKGALQWADIVVCVTRAAQHAATNEIDRSVSEDMLIRPGGKGSSSILRDLAKWRDEQLHTQLA